MNALEGDNGSIVAIWSYRGDCFHILRHLFCNLALWSCFAAEILAGRGLHRILGSRCLSVALVGLDAASFASLSANSLPRMSAWPAIQFSDRAGAGLYGRLVVGKYHRWKGDFSPLGE